MVCVLYSVFCIPYAVFCILYSVLCPPQVENAKVFLADFTSKTSGPTSRSHKGYGIYNGYEYQDMIMLHRAIIEYICDI